MIQGRPEGLLLLLSYRIFPFLHFYMKPPFRIFLIPFALLLFVLGADRLLNLSVLQKRMRPRASNMEVLDQFNRLVLRDLEEKSDGRPLVVFIGSSRSLPFQILKDVRNDPFLKREEKTFLQGFRFEGRTATPLPDVLSQLLLIDRLLDSHFAIDTIVLDVSPFVPYNPGIMRRRWTRNIYPKDFLWRHAMHFPADLRSDAVSRLVFPSYNYRLDPLLLFRKRDPRTLDPVYGALLLYKNPLRYSYGIKKDWSIEDTYDPKNKSKFMKKTRGAARELYSAYDPQLSLADLFVYSLRLLQDRSRHLVLWLAPTHPFFQRLVYQKLNPSLRGEQVFWERYFRLLQNARASGLDFSFYNGYHVRRRCDYWLDGSHLSPRCYGVLALEILQCRNQDQEGRKEAQRGLGCRLPSGPLPYLSKPK